MSCAGLAFAIMLAMADADPITIVPNQTCQCPARGTEVKCASLNIEGTAEVKCGNNGLASKSGTVTLYDVGDGMSFDHCTMGSPDCDYSIHPEGITFTVG